MTRREYCSRDRERGRIRNGGRKRDTERGREREACDDGTEQNRKQKEKKKAEVVKKGG